MSSFDAKRIYDILRATTGQFRKGAVFQGSPNLVTAAQSGDPEALGKAGGGVLEVYAMPHEREADGLEKVDLHFVTVAVNKEKAEARRDELVALLNDYPNPQELRNGPSYIAVGGVLGDQGAAFELFALGKVLGLWDIITPETFGMTGAEARQAAGAGYIMITPYSVASGMEAASAGETNEDLARHEVRQPGPEGETPNV